MYAKKSPSVHGNNAAPATIGKFASNPFVIIGYSVMLIAIALCLARGCSSSDGDRDEEMQHRISAMQRDIARITRERDEYRDKLEELQLRQENPQSRISSGNNGSEKPKPQLPLGKCHLSQDKSPIDDSVVATVTCVANERNPRSYRDPGCLVVRHKEGEDSVYIVFDDYLGSGNISVTMRIDSGNAETAQWSISTDGKAAFYKGDVSALINQFCRSEKLTIRATPYSESPRTYTFDIGNFGTELSPVRYLFR